jgi:hypothetical protein
MMMAVVGTRGGGGGEWSRCAAYVAVRCGHAQSMYLDATPECSSLTPLSCAHAARYERGLRAQMLQKADDERRQRAVDAEMRRAEAERLQQELEFKRAWEAEQAGKAAQEQQRAKEEAERRARHVQEQREKEARAEAARWRGQEEAMKKEREAAMMPAWKRDLVAKKRTGDGTETVFPGAAPRR